MTRLFQCWAHSSFVTSPRQRTVNRWWVCVCTCRLWWILLPLSAFIPTANMDQRHKCVAHLYLILRKNILYNNDCIIIIIIVFVITAVVCNIFHQALLLSVITCSCCLNTKLAVHTSCYTTCSFTAILFWVLCVKLPWTAVRWAPHPPTAAWKRRTEGSKYRPLRYFTWELVLHGLMWSHGAFLQPKSNQSRLIYLHLLWASIVFLASFFSTRAL